MKSAEKNCTGTNSNIKVEISIHVAGVMNRVIRYPKRCPAFGELEPKSVCRAFLSDALQLVPRWVAVGTEVHGHHGILWLVPEQNVDDKGAPRKGKRHNLELGCRKVS